MTDRWEIRLDYPVRPEPRYGHGRPPHRRLRELIERGRPGYRTALERIARYEDDLRRIPALEESAAEPYWRCGWLGGLDAAGLYWQLAERRPSRYVEIGSGHSTRFARRAIRDQGLATTIISIDPEPRAEVDALCDVLVRTRLEDADLSILHDLAPDDVLFVDGSHRSFANSDVTVFFLEVLPELATGVHVALHDVYLPDDYPVGWEDYFFNEQYLLAVHLLAGGRCEVVFPAAFVSSDPELSALAERFWARLDIPELDVAGSTFWMRMTGEPNRGPRPLQERSG